MHGESVAKLTHFGNLLLCDVEFRLYVLGARVTSEFRKFCGRGLWLYLSHLICQQICFDKFAMLTPASYCWETRALTFQWQALRATLGA